MVEGGGGSVGSSAARVATLPPPKPKSPPEYPDLYGKRRELAKVQLLEREISYLEGELKFVESLPPASQCCKEVADFVVASSDPFMPSERTHRSCSLWKWLCRAPCLLLSSVCCFGCNLKKPRCCNCNCNCKMHKCCPSCVNCTMPKCRCCACPWSKCLNNTLCEIKCCLPWCCLPRCFRCPDCSCKCRFSCPKVNLCCCCTKNCCYSCWLCY